MGDTYTRQSSYTDGDVITAAHTNNEFNQLLAAFATSSGHTHDGTAAEGGPISSLLSNTLTFGTGADTDIAITFNANTADGVLTWKEDEDYFEFSDDILIASTEKLQFRDTAIYINSSADGQLDIVADTEIQIAATTVDINGAVALNGAITGATNITLSGELDAATLDISGNADIDGNLDVGGNLVVTGTTTFNGGTLTLGDANTDNIVFGGEVDSNIIPDDDDTFDLGSASKQWKDLYVDGVAYVDAINYNGTAITATPAEINLIDGGTAASSVTIVDADRLILNDDGTMKQIAVTSLAAYLDDEITAMPNLTSVGTLGTLTVDNIIINGTTIGHTSDTDAMTIASNGNITMSQNLTVTGDLTVSGDDITMGTNTAGHILVADGTNFNPIAVTDLSEISTVASGDIFLAVDASGGGLKKITRSAVVSGLATSSAISNVVEDTSPQLGGNLDMNGADIVTTSNADIELAPNGTGHVTVRGNNNQGTIQFNCESNSHGQKIKAAPHSESANNVLTLPSTGGDARLVSTASTATLTNKTLTSPKINEDVAVTSTATELNVLDGITAVVGELNALDIGSTAIGTAVASKAVILDANKDYTGIRNLTATGDVVVGGDLTINGDTVTASVTNMVVADNLIELNNGATSNSNDSGIVIERGSTGDNAIFMWDESADTFVLGTTTATGASTGNLSVTDGALQAGSLDISGNIDVDGTANLDVVDIDGAVNMATTATITGNLTLGAQLIMPDVTSTKILVADGTSFQEVAISGDVTIANTGAVTIAANAVEGSMLNDNAISGQTALTSGLASDDELLVSDGGTLKRMDVSVLTTVTDDSATALAIALG
jgi:cytoskeletal protein CcmA (bactofilin family)